MRAYQWCTRDELADRVPRPARSWRSRTDAGEPGDSDSRLSSPPAQCRAWRLGRRQPMNKSLVLVGMNVRPLAQSAVAAGFDVVALNAFGLLDLPSRARCLSLASDLGGLFPGDPGSWHTRLA